MNLLAQTKKQTMKLISLVGKILCNARNGNSGDDSKSNWKLVSIKARNFTRVVHLKEYSPIRKPWERSACTYGEQ